MYAYKQSLFCSLLLVRDNRSIIRKPAVLSKSVAECTNLELASTLSHFVDMEPSIKEDVAVVRRGAAGETAIQGRKDDVPHRAVWKTIFLY